MIQGENSELSKSHATLIALVVGAIGFGLGFTIRGGSNNSGPRYKFHAVGERAAAAFLIRCDLQSGEADTAFVTPGQASEWTAVGIPQALIDQSRRDISNAFRHVAP